MFVGEQDMAIEESEHLKAVAALRMESWEWETEKRVG